MIYVTVSLVSPMLISECVIFAPQADEQFEYPEIFTELAVAVQLYVMEPPVIGLVNGILVKVPLHMVTSTGSFITGLGFTVTTTVWI
jgi:hypothetical protein